MMVAKKTLPHNAREDSTAYQGPDGLPPDILRKEKIRHLQPDTLLL